MPRAINSSAITMGLVVVPIKVYTAAQSKKVSFCQLTPDDNSVKQQWVDATTGKTVERSNFKRGYEYIKGKKGQPGKTVEITDAELDSIAAKSSLKAIEIKEFIKADAMPSIAVEKTYYLGPDDAGERGYALFTQVMRDKGGVALAHWTVRGRGQLVAIRPHSVVSGLTIGHGLVLQQLFYTDEIRDFTAIGVSGVEASQPEVDMAGQFVDAMTSEAYDASKYRNEYAAKVHDLVNKKVNGQAIDVSKPDEPQQDLMDMFAQLKASVDQMKKAS